jgi:hypothetical protein
MQVKHTIPYHNCIYNSLPEDEPSGSKYVEEIKNSKTNKLILEIAFCWFILYNCHFILVVGTKAIHLYLD